MKIRWIILAFLTGLVLTVGFMIPRNYQNYNAAVVLDAEKDYWKTIACLERKIDECK